MSGSRAGRRERKKVATRTAIAGAALRLFLERGFEQVTVAEVAEAADVAEATVFNHFASKEALVLDEDDEREAALVGAVRDRGPGVSIVDALHRYVLTLVTARTASGELRQFQALVASTPSLREHAHRMWARHEDALAAVIAAEVGLSAVDPGVRALAHLVIESPAVATTDDVDPRAGIDAVFAVLRHGWSPTTGAPLSARPTDRPPTSPTQRTTKP